MSRVYAHARVHTSWGPHPAHPLSTPHPARVLGAQPLAVTLNLSANLDLFGMDVVNKDLEDGMLENLIEHVLSGYGPQAAACPMPGFAGKIFGWSQKTFFSELGNGRPFVIDLSGKQAG